LPVLDAIPAIYDCAVDYIAGAWASDSNETVDRIVIGIEITEALIAQVKGRV
jgi:hypothetical protein